MSKGRKSPAERFKAIPKLEANAFVPQLANALEALGNRLEREWPATIPEPPGSATLLRTLVLASGNTWRTVRYVCADLPKDPARKIEYALALVPLARVILEAVFTVVFLFEDLPGRTEWFWKSAWRDVHEEYARLEAEYGADPTWTDWLSEMRNLRDARAQLMGIALKPRDSLRKIAPWWPLPGAMAKPSSEWTLSQERLSRLHYLEEQFYGQFSASAHLKGPGLSRSAAALLDRKRDADATALLEKSRSDVFGESTTMLLALLSEVELELGYGHAEQLRYVWTVLGDLLGYVKDLYERHYRTRFEKNKR